MQERHLATAIIAQQTIRSPGATVSEQSAMIARPSYDFAIIRMTIRMIAGGSHRYRC